MGNCFVISDGGLFLFRFNDSGFGSKWMGLWRGEDKLLEYWAIRTGGRWMAPGNNSAFSLDAEFQIARSSFFGGEAAEEVGFNREGFYSKATSAKPEKMGIELAINLRKAFQNATGQTYRVASFDKGALTVEGSGGGRVEITGLGEFDVTSAFHKRHRPGDRAESLGWKYFNEEEQDCFVVTLESRGELSEAAFVVRQPAPQKRPAMPKAGESFSSSDKAVAAFVSSAAEQMKTFLNGRGRLSAGHPYFMRFWVRDACINVPGFVNLGLADEMRAVLEEIGGRQREDGCIPNIIGDGGDAEYFGADTTPLWMLAVHHCIQFTGDAGFMREKLLRAAGFFSIEDVDGDGFAETDRGSVFDPFPHFTTWMDSIERSGKAIEVQLLWAEALKRVGALCSDRAMESKGESLLRRAEDKFWKEEWDYFLDCIGGPTQNVKSCNVLFGLANGSVSRVKAKRCLETLESGEFTFPWGVATASAKNANFFAGAYHTGAAWNLLTGLMSLAEFRAGRPEKGLAYLRILHDNFGRRCENGLDELYDEDGRPQGAVNQGWSTCLIPRIFDEGLLGITPKATEGILEMSPRLPAGMTNLGRRHLKFNGDSLEIFLERTTSGRTHLQVAGLRKSHLRFFPPPGAAKVYAAGKVVPADQPLLMKGYGDVRIEWT